MNKIIAMAALTTSIIVAAKLITKRICINDKSPEEINDLESFYEGEHAEPIPEEEVSENPDVDAEDSIDDE